MRSRRMTTCCVLLLAVGLTAACASAADSAGDRVDLSEVIRLGPGMVAPHVLEKVEPEFTEAAREASVQGTVLLDLVVNRFGRTQNVSLLSPLGFGLDENAVAAVERWRFRPAMYQGKAVSVYATVEVDFRYQNTVFDKKKEQQRQRYNIAVKWLSGDASEAAAGALQMEALAKEKIPAAAYAYAFLLEEGRFFPRDQAAANKYYRIAADAGHGEAISRLALETLEQGGSGDKEAAIEQLREASLLGSRMAQRWLGTHHLTGEGVPRDKARAERQLRRCAAQGDPHCQFFLGRSMLNGGVTRAETGLGIQQYLQALAWLSLAETGGILSARVLAQPHWESLDERQIAWIRRLQEQLLQKEHWVPATAN